VKIGAIFLFALLASTEPSKVRVPTAETMPLRFC
jgi:hypothetical protein